VDEKLESTSEMQAAQLATIDQGTLTPLVQRALGSKTVEVANWAFEQLHGVTIPSTRPRRTTCWSPSNSMEPTRLAAVGPLRCNIEELAKRLISRPLGLAG
jgi:hypothetical protein